MTRLVGDPTTASIQEIVQPLASIIAIALGILCGSAAFDTLDDGSGRRAIRRFAGRGSSR